MAQTLHSSANMDGVMQQYGPRRRLGGPREDREPGGGSAGGKGPREGAAVWSWGETALQLSLRWTAAWGDFCHRVWRAGKVGPRWDTHGPVRSPVAGSWVSPLKELSRAGKETVATLR